VFVQPGIEVAGAFGEGGGPRAADAGVSGARQSPGRSPPNMRGGSITSELGSGPVEPQEIKAAVLRKEDRCILDATTRSKDATRGSWPYYQEQEANTSRGSEKKTGGNGSFSRFCPAGPGSSIGSHGHPHISFSSLEEHVSRRVVDQPRPGSVKAGIMIQDGWLDSSRKTRSLES